jgi:predicted nucleic-acid-binding protein
LPALDANVLVRFIVRDDPVQSALAARFIERCVSAGEPLFVPVTVALELEWVLRASFGFGKDAVLATLSSLLSAHELVFESERALAVALLEYGRGSADYADCLHAALASLAFAEPLWTFDKAASKVAGARLLDR